MKPDVLVELKALRLHGMAGAWADLVEQGGNAGIESSRWLIEHLLQAEGTDRVMRSVSHQMKAAMSRCTGTWRALTSRSRRWTASW